MESSREIRVQRLTDILKRELKRTSDRAYWVGIAIGLVLGLIAGAAIGYHLGSPQTIVIPLEQGVKV